MIGTNVCIVLQYSRSRSFANHSTTINTTDWRGLRGATRVVGGGAGGESVTHLRVISVHSHTVRGRLFRDRGAIYADDHVGLEQHRTNNDESNQIAPLRRRPEVGQTVL